MTVYTRADAVDRLPDIDRHRIEIAKHIAADFVRQSANCFPTEHQIDRHLLLRGDQFRRLALNERRLKYVLGNMSYNGHTHAVAADMVSVIIAVGKHVVVIQTHEPRSFARR